MEAYPAVHESKTQEIQVSTLNAQQAARSFEEPILLKLDVQGFEYEVLTGGDGFLAKVRWVILETTTEPMYEGETLFLEIHSLLTAHGYRFVGPLDIHFSPSGAAKQFDALFVQTGHN